jgi:hypothetical protein
MIIDLPIAAPPWYVGAAVKYTLRDVAGAVIDGRQDVAMSDPMGDGNFLAIIAGVDTLNWPAAFVYFKDVAGIVEVKPLLVPANMAQANSTQIELSPAASGANRKVKITERSTRAS